LSRKKYRKVKIVSEWNKRASANNAKEQTHRQHRLKKLFLGQLTANQECPEKFYCA